jgi:hypothetical protein
MSHNESVNRGWLLEGMGLQPPSTPFTSVSLLPFINTCDDELYRSATISKPVSGDTSGQLKSNVVYRVPVTAGERYIVIIKEAHTWARLSKGDKDNGTHVKIDDVMMAENFNATSVSGSNRTFAKFAAYNGIYQVVARDEWLTIGQYVRFQSITTAGGLMNALLVVKGDSSSLSGVCTEPSFPPLKITDAIVEKLRLKISPTFTLLEYVDKSYSEN